MPPFSAAPMEREGRSRKAVGVYDRPASADRKRGAWVWIVVAALIAMAWTAYFAFGRGG